MNKIDLIIRDVCELPDDAPDDADNVVTVRLDDLRTILEHHIDGDPVEA